MRHTRALALLALLLTAPVLASAQTGDSPVLVEKRSDSHQRVEDGAAFYDWRLFNLNSKTPFYVSISAEAPSGWEPRVSRTGFFLEARNETQVTVSFDAVGKVAERATFKVTFRIANSETGTVSLVEETVTATVVKEAKVFGVFPNLLPAPLDNVYGIFLMEAGFWLVIGLGSILVGDSVVYYLARKAPVAVVKEVLHRIRRPIFYFVVLLGLRYSLRILPEDRITLVAHGFLTVLAFAFVGAYMAYRILDAVLYYYTVELAPRTRTSVDDVLIPAVRKLSVVVLFIYGLAATLKHAFNVELTFLLGAAGIMGLVIAFAAQDTLSNFFSGVFLLLDQPFREGDDVQLETNEICRVEKIGLRSTRLLHYRNHEIIVLPNNQLASRRVVNLMLPDRRYRIAIEVGVAYGTDIEKVKRILNEVALAHPNVLRGKDVDPFIMFTRFGESSLDFLMLCFVDDLSNRGRAASELRQALHDRFAREGIEIPFPQRTLWVKGPVAVEERSLIPDSAQRASSSAARPPSER